jgi:putative redox protein
MTSVRHIAHATASTGSDAPAYRVDVEAARHRMVADESVGAGGGDAGPSPFGFLVSGLAACTAMTLRMYAERKNWELRSIAVDIRYDIDDAGDAHIERTITLPSELDSEQRRRLGEIAEKTPVTLAVRNGTPISTTLV